MPETSGFFPPWERIKRIFALGLPIMAGMSTYVFLELVDLLFVGRLGTTALASVGISVFLVFLFLAIFGGVSIAVQATTSRLVGESQGEIADLGRYLRTTLVIVFTVVPPVSLILVWFAGDVLSLMTDDPEVVASGTWYLAWMFGSSVFFAINSAFMGFWNATERASLYLRVVVLEAVINVPLNYVFMFGLDPIPSYGVTGAGIGTFIAAVVGAAYHLLLGLKHARGFHRGAVREHLGVVVRLMVPAGMQQFMDSLALTLMFRIVAMVGTLEVAAYSVLVNMVSAVGMPAWGLGLAGATLVGQAMGAKNMEDADRWAWDVIKIGVLAMVLLGVPFWLFPELILSQFIREESALAAAVLPCRVLGLMIGFNGVGYLFTSMLNGAGDVKRVMYVNLATQYLVLLPGAYFFGIWAGFGLIGIWLTHQLGFRALNSVILTTLWRQKRWQKIELW
jgi:MATE family multidrug resistance protein